MSLDAAIENSKMRSEPASVAGAVGQSDRLASHNNAAGVAKSEFAKVDRSSCHLYGSGGYTNAATTAAGGSCTTTSSTGESSRPSGATTAVVVDEEQQKQLRPTELARSSQLSLQSGFVKQSLAVAGMSLGCVLDGTVIAYSSPALPSLQSPSSSIEINLHHGSWIGSVHTLGAVIGCLLSIPAMDRLGRRGAALYVMSLAYLLGYLCIGFAVNVEMIIFGRLMGGVGLGLTLSITPVYLVEVSDIDYRGMLGVIPPILTQIGLLVTYVAGIWLDWKNLALSGIALVVPNIVFIWAIPESPVYLASKGFFSAAEDSLARLGREEVSTSFFKKVQGETQHFSSPDVFSPSPRVNRSNSVAYRFYTHPAVWRPTIVCFAIMFFFQATGYNTIIAYTKIIFKRSGLLMDESLAVGITGFVVLLSSILALGMSKVLKRRSLLFTSSIGCSINLVIMGFYYYLEDSGDYEDLLQYVTWLPLACMFTFITAFMVGFGAVAWTVMAEILPSSARGQIYPFAVAFTWICNFFFTHIFAYIKEFYSFWMFGALTVFGLLFVVRCVPETRGKSADEVAHFFCPQPSLSQTALTEKNLANPC